MATGHVLLFGIADGNGSHVVPDKELGVLYAIPDNSE